MSSKLEALKAAQAEALAIAEREDSLGKLFSVAPKYIIFHKRGGVSRPFLYFDATSVKEAVEILNSFGERMAASKVEGTFLSIKPLGWFDQKELDGAKDIIDGQAGSVELTIDGGKGYGPQAKLRGWVTLPNGEEAELTVSLGVYPSGNGYPAQWWVRSNVEYDRSGNVKTARHDPPNICADEPAIRWGTGSRDAYRFGWFWMAKDSFELEMERYYNSP